MAELLVKAIDATHSDSIIDKAGCYKKWDIVVIQEDGHVWGSSEGLPKFFQISVPGVLKSQLFEVLSPKEIVVNDIQSWNKLEYEDAILSGFWRNFISAPTNTGEVINNQTVNVLNETWTNMQAVANYAPFYTLPVATPVDATTVDLLGDVITVTLDGSIKKVETRRQSGIVESIFSTQDLLDITANGTLTLDFLSLQALVLDKESVTPVIL